MGCNFNSSVAVTQCTDIAGTQSAQIVVEIWPSPFLYADKIKIYKYLFSLFSTMITEMTIRPTFSDSGHSSDVLKVERPYYEQEQFNSELNYCQIDDSRDKNSICSRIKNVKPTRIFLSVFPLFTWLSQYNVKSDIVGDLVSGCTVAIMHIPQGKHRIDDQTN